MFNRFLGYETADVRKIFNDTTVYQNNKETYPNNFQYMVRRGVNGMDNYDANNQPIFEVHEFGWPIWIIVAILGVFGALFVWAIIKCIFCPSRKVVKSTVYLKYEADEVQAVEWP